MMSSKKQKPIDLRNLEPEEKMKYEIAEELGLLDRVLAEGWKGLTSKRNRAYRRACDKEKTGTEKNGVSRDNLDVENVNKM